MSIRGVVIVHESSLAGQHLIDPSGCGLRGCLECAFLVKERAWEEVISFSGTWVWWREDSEGLLSDIGFHCMIWRLYYSLLSHYYSDSGSVNW